MTTDTRKKAQGFVEPQGENSLSGRGAKIPPKKQPPHVPSGQRGINVTLVPIPGVSLPSAFPKGKGFTFQVQPLGTFPVDGDATHNDYQTVGDGEHSSPGSGRNLRTVSYDTVFIDWQPPWSMLHGTGWAPDPQDFIKQLEKIRDSLKPFHLLVHQAQLRNSYDIDWAATLRSVHWELRDGEDDAYYVTVAFTEFRSQSVQEFLVGAAQHKDLPAKLDIKSLPDDRNTMHNLAIYYYGDPSKSKLIASANGLTKIPPSSNLKISGTGRTTITIPAVRSTKSSKGQHR